MSSMQQYSSPDGLVGPWHLVHLGSRAVGGVGLVISEATVISPEGRNALFDNGLWNEAQVAAGDMRLNSVKRVASAVGAMAVTLVHKCLAETFQ
jgi:2,4-dienoyl-CoA reductase-like NADH-dependent reductase (Old Yellow Enzyme family)